ncbi:MAG: hypothetical protein IPM25_06840 [Chloracidobacterium sp.]|nr:hypothetical protein [Chloracidobacterium sp.]
MNRFFKPLFLFAAASVLVLGLAPAADAQKRNERAVRDAVRSLDTQIDDLKYSIDFEVRNNGGTVALSDAGRGLENLKDKVGVFESDLDARREDPGDISEIVTAAKDVDAALLSARTLRSINDQWAETKRTIEKLALEYGVAADWSVRMSNGSRDTVVPVRATVSVGLTGTYRLDPSRSEKAADIISSTGVADVHRRELESKLEAPEQLAILVRGRQVTLASSIAEPVSIDADGREKVETNGGRQIRLKATLKGQQLVVSSLGGETDYTITFVSADNGRTLKVTRRITTEYLDETIFAESVYTKTDNVAGLGIDDGGTTASNDDSYSSSDQTDTSGQYGRTPAVVTQRSGDFVVPNGVAVSGVLENDIDTKVSQNNDRFRLTVQTPEEYRGAIIEGYISGVGRSGQISGRSNVTFNFTKITLADGKSYDFAGSLQNIQDVYGKDVKIDEEGAAKGDSQTKETVKRGGIGAGIGALIGAIAGGGKGAAIGAIIGGGAGAGSVAIQGRTDVKIQKGSTMTVVSSSPLKKDENVSEN